VSVVSSKPVVEPERGGARWEKESGGCVDISIAGNEWESGGDFCAYHDESTLMLIKVRTNRLGTAMRGSSDLFVAQFGRGRGSQEL